MFKELKIENCKLKIIAALVVIVSGLILTTGIIKAQTTQKGITVVPSIAHVDLATDPAEYSLNYTNNTSYDITLSLSVQDFTELEDSYKISFLEGKDAANYKYSLSSWITFENKELQLNPNETKSVKVFIDKNRITKGGHYASILATIEQPADNKQIAVKGILSSLLFVRASTGKEIEEGKIDSFEPYREGIDYPSSYTLKFDNSGNVHVIPYGTISVFDPLGNLVGKGSLNFDSLDALPESIRLYNSPVTTYQKILLPGVYTAKVDLHFGKNDQKLTSSVKFFSQGGFNFVKIAIGLVILLILMLYLRKRLKKPALK
jgi:hypothetical protein